MAVDEVLAGVAPDILLEIGRVGLWVQAVGLIVVFWIVFQAITMYYNRKRRLTLYSIEERLQRLEQKLDAAMRKRKTTSKR